MKQNFDVLISEEAKESIKSLDIKIQKKIAYNLQKSREVNDTRLLKKLNDEIWEFRIDTISFKFDYLPFGIQIENHKLSTLMVLLRRLRRFQNQKL